MKRAALLLAVGIALGAAGAAVAAGDGVIRACAGPGGALRLADRCTNREQRLEWSVAGPRGLPGPSGEPGPQGEPGPAFTGDIAADAEPGPVELTADGADFRKAWGHEAGKWLITFKVTLENTSDAPRNVACVLEADVGELDRTRETLAPGEVETVSLLIVMHVAYHLNGKSENSGSVCTADGPGVLATDRLETTALVGVVPYPE